MTDMTSSFVFKRAGPMKVFILYYLIHVLFIGSNDKCISRLADSLTVR